MENTFQRAKSPENKNIRLNRIMEITDDLFHRYTYHEITLSTISKEMGLARGGLYKYVTSKEEVFLLLYLKKEEAFVKEISDALETVQVNIEGFADIFSEHLFAHLDLLKYHQILTAIIETNVSVEKLAEFKSRNHAIITGLCSALHFHDEKRWFHTYLTIMYHAVYLYDRVAYHDNYEAAMKLAGLEIERIDFKEELARFIQIIFSNEYYGAL